MATSTLRGRVAAAIIVAASHGWADRAEAAGGAGGIVDQAIKERVRPAHSQTHHCEAAVQAVGLFDHKYAGGLSGERKYSLVGGRVNFTMRDVSAAVDSDVGVQRLATIGQPKSRSFRRHMARRPGAVILQSSTARSWYTNWAYFAIGSSDSSSSASLK